LPKRRNQAQLDVYSGEAALFTIYQAGVQMRVLLYGRLP
jgi:hypothetical protein